MESTQGNNRTNIAKTCLNIVLMLKCFIITYDMFLRHAQFLISYIVMGSWKGRSRKPVHTVGQGSVL